MNMHHQAGGTFVYRYSGGPERDIHVPGVSFLMDLLLIDLMILRDSAKPRLDWDSEVELSRKLGAVNIIAMVFGVVMLMAFIIAMFIIPSIEDPATMQAAFISVGKTPASISGG